MCVCECMCDIQIFIKNSFNIFLSNGNNNFFFNYFITFQMKNMLYKIDRSLVFLPRGIFAAIVPPVMSAIQTR